MKAVKLEWLSFIPNHFSRNVRKRPFVHVRPAKTQISLCIRAVWSESSLGAFCIAKDAKFLHAYNEYFDLTARVRRLIWVYTGSMRQKVRFLAWRRIPQLLPCFFFVNIRKPV